MTQNSEERYTDNYRLRIQGPEDKSGKKLRALCPLPVESKYVTLPAHPYVHQPGSSTKPWCPEFNQSRWTLLIKSPAILLNLVSSPHLLPGEQASPNSQPSNHMIGFLSDQPPFWNYLGTHHARVTSLKLKKGTPVTGEILSFWSSASGNTDKD